MAETSVNEEDLEWVLVGFGTGVDVGYVVVLLRDDKRVQGRFIQRSTKHNN
jgi:hypothetical protein